MLVFESRTCEQRRCDLPVLNHITTPHPTLCGLTPPLHPQQRTRRPAPPPNDQHNAKRREQLFRIQLHREAEHLSRTRAPPLRVGRALELPRRRCVRSSSSFKLDTIAEAQSSSIFGGSPPRPSRCACFPPPPAAGDNAALSRGARHPSLSFRSTALALSRCSALAMATRRYSSAALCAHSSATATASVRMASC